MADLTDTLWVDHVAKIPFLNQNSVKTSNLTRNCVENVNFDILSLVNVENLEPESVKIVKFDSKLG